MRRVFGHLLTTLLIVVSAPQSCRAFIPSLQSTTNERAGWKKSQKQSLISSQSKTKSISTPSSSSFPGRTSASTTSLWQDSPKSRLLAVRSSSSSSRGRNKSAYSALLERIATTLSQSYNALAASPAEVRSARDRRRVSVLTLLRVSIPSLLAGVGAYLIFPALALSMASSMHDPGVFAVLSQDSSQFVQNFLTVSGLLFSILVGQTCEYNLSISHCIILTT